METSNTPNGKPRVGIAGVGQMGHGIASNILKAGYPLVLLDHPGNQPVGDLLSRGARQAATPAEVARQSDIVVLCVTGTPQVEDVLLRDDGVLAGLRPQGIVIDCSTAIPSSTLKVARAVTDAGGRFLDAPMTRTPKEAAEGRLNLIVGGDRALFEYCLPLLRSYAENITHAGPVGAGHRLKLLHNYVSLGFSAVLAEAAACAERAQVDRAVLMDILAKGGGDGVVLGRLRPYIEHGDTEAFRFSIANALKDMGYYTAMAEETGAPHAAAEAIRDTYAAASEAGIAQAPVPEIIDFLAGGARK
ncbi:2-hydroxy-3-oxopropionate reductase [Bordetella genomosp. 10]|uniref:2-hydroxy-3-oxopropionate reductase n=1 Tax=Bordetella genomosp. 10 TaxID=1416804 RepID=A0A261SLU9_9BORD|nr:NAD(P)-dependent oxidoreductase [Bordetella genomosp. 10]OZI38398.1 2-hydroxy-3-oxopropionate reductase [Bordetella genomosp. 10]